MAGTWKCVRYFRASRLAWAVALVTLAASPFWAYSLTARVLRWNAEPLLAKAYTESRPFLFRLPDAGYASVQDGESRTYSPLLLLAVARLRAAQSVLHNQPEIQRLLGRAAFLTGDYDGAVSRYLRTLELDSHSPNARLELAGVLMVRAQRQRRPVDLAAALEQTGKANRLEPANSVDSYNLALLYEAIPAPYLARAEWARCIRLERAPTWLVEEKYHWSSLNRLLEERAVRVRALTAGPASFLSESARRPYPPETVLDEAISTWLPRMREDTVARQALDCVAARFQERHADPWLADLLLSPDAGSVRPAFPLLAEACRKNREGLHEEATLPAHAAQELFRQSGNRAGELRARLELVIAAHRAQNGVDCLSRAQALVRDLQSTKYVWMKAQAWLEESTCRSITGDSGRLVSEREDALNWIRQTGYEGMELRALGFLIQPELVRSNPMRLWRIAHEGLVRFWDGEAPAVRAQQLYVATALSARDGGYPLAAVAMAREGVRVMEEVDNPQWKALCRSLLGSIELSAGLDTDAAETFRDAETRFEACKPSETVRRYRLEAVLSRADAETLAGSPASAAGRLTLLRHQFSTFGDTQETTPFEQALGLAYLGLERFDDAFECFGKVVKRTRAALARVNDQRQRDGILKAADASYRGEIFQRLVRQHDPAAAFALWQAYRAARTRLPPGAVELMPPDLAMLAVVALPGGAAIFAADRTAVEAKWIPGGSVPLNEAARLFAVLCGSPSSSQAEIDRAGRVIFDTVIGPFEQRLLGRHSLAIIAEGSLASVPWSALRDRRGRQLIEYQTMVLPSDASFVKRLAAENTPGRRPLVIAAPALAAELVADYPPLGDSLREAKAIARRFPNARVLTGRAANVAAVKEFLPDSAFFHFGGHGTANGGYGAILLAPETGMSYGGVWDASEIGRLDLRGVRVVSLASCSSAAGQMAGPANPDSLVLALLDAGVHNVIAAPWSVDSESTSLLFADFYDRLTASAGAAEALRHACLRVRSLPGTVHPFFWAGFQTYGDPD